MKNFYRNQRLRCVIELDSEDASTICFTDPNVGDAGDPNDDVALNQDESEEEEYISFVESVTDS